MKRVHLNQISKLKLQFFDIFLSYKSNLLITEIWVITLHKLYLGYKLNIEK